MESVLPLLKRLPVLFSRLAASLSVWKNTGHGLWPLQGQPEYEFEELIQLLYHTAGDCLNKRIPRPVTLSALNSTLAADILDGPELLALINWLLDIFSLSPANSDANYCYATLNQLRWALIALLYPEEPGEVTVDEVLAGH